MTAPALFDHALMHLRRRARPPHLAAPLKDLLAQEFKERLSLIRRSFASAAVFGPFASELAEKLVDSPQLSIGRQRNFEEELELQGLRQGSFDCILFGFGFETVNDLPGALTALRRALKPDGLFLAALFAGNTLCELRASWLAAEEASRGGASPRVAPFADLRDLGGLLQRAGFALPVADIDRIVLRYPDALALMKEIKRTGFNAVLRERSRRPVTAGLLAAAAHHYERNFSDAEGRVRATVDIAWLTGWAPHESQPKPVKPGSATARLADALGTEERHLTRD